MNILFTEDMFEVLFQDFITKTAIRKEQGLDVCGPNNNPRFELFWDPSDRLSSDTLNEIIKNTKKDPEIGFLGHVTDYIYDHWFDSIDDDYNDAKYDTLRAFAEHYDLDYDELSSEFSLAIDETWQKTVYFDLNLETLLRHSSPDDLVLYFGTYWDDEAYAMNEWTLEKPRITYLRKSPLAWLARTQGYTIDDIFNNKKSL